MHGVCKRGTIGILPACPSHRFAMSDRRHPPMTTPRHASQRIRVVLVRTSHPGNIGAAARAMLTMGLTHLVLVAPRALSRSRGRRARLRRDASCSTARDVVATLDEALAGCALPIGLSARPREFAGPRAAGARGGARGDRATRRDGDVALVFGTEMSGLSNDELARCGDRRDDSRESRLRVAQSRRGGAGRGVRAARRGAGRRGVARAALRSARRTTKSRALHAHARRTLDGAALPRSARCRSACCRGLRRLFGRAGLEREEVNILRGILARVDELIATGRGTGNIKRKARGE